MPKKLLVFIAILGVVANLIACKPISNTPVPTKTTTSAATTAPVTQTYVTMEQFNTLSQQVSQLQSQLSQLAPNSAVNTLQAQVNGLITSIGDAKTKMNEAATTSAAVKASLDSLTQSINELQLAVTALQSATLTVIGTTPVTINGLSVTFLSNSVPMGVVNDKTVGYAQMTVKITNTNAYSLVNVDVIGIITMGSIYNVAAGYPQLADGASNIVYNAYFNGSSSISFETYYTKTSATAIANLTIPKGGSITLRPRVAFLATTGTNIAATTVTLSISTIAYDKGP